MDRIDAFRMYVRVVETGGFSRAARDLGVTQPTVTRQVSALENALGLRLLNRNTRRVSVTEAGREYYDKCKALLELYDETESFAPGRRSTLRGRIRIATSIAFGRRIVTPLVLDFMRTYPEVQCDLRCEDAYVDLVAQGIDVAIRMGRLGDSSLGARYLGRNPWVTVAAPTYLKRHGTPKHPQDLAQHPVLVYSTVQGDDRLHYDAPGGGRISVAVQGPLRSNNLSAILAAVRASMGIAALPTYVAAASLAAGQVRSILRDFPLPAQEIHAVFPSPKLLPTKVGTLIEHFRQAFELDDWPVRFAQSGEAVAVGVGQGRRS